MAGDDNMKKPLLLPARTVSLRRIVVNGDCKYYRSVPIYYAIYCYIVGGELIIYILYIMVNELKVLMRRA